MQEPHLIACRWAGTGYTEYLRGSRGSDGKIPSSDCFRMEGYRLMPRVRIESTIKYENDTARRIVSAIMDTIVETLQLVDDDRTVSYTTFEDGFFQMKPPYTLFIEIILFSGRSREIKRKLFHNLAEKISSGFTVKRDGIMIVLNEQPRENWGLRGGIPGDEIKFDYPVAL